MKINNNVSLVGLFFAVLMMANHTMAQQVHSAKESTITTNGQELKGYSIELDFEEKEIFRAWWKYSKEFSRNETKKNDIKHTIPPKEGESTVPIIYYSTVEAVDSLNSRIKAAVADIGLSSDQLSKYSKQVKELLEDFRLNYYKDNLQRKISQTEKLAQKVGRQLDRSNTTRLKLQEQLESTKISNENHRQAITDNDSLMINLQDQLVMTLEEKDSLNQSLESVKLKLEELKELLKGIQ